MQFVCDKKEILKLTNIVTKAVAYKSLNTVLEHILIEAAHGTVTMKCTDMVLSIQSEITATVKENGNVAVTARLFHEIINKYPEGEIEFKTEDNNQLTIACGHSKASLNFMNTDEFPSFPQIERKSGIKIKENEFRKMINQTVFSSAIAEDKPILTGALFEAEEKSLKLVALDGYRLAIRKEAIETIEDKILAVVPSKSLRETSRILEDTDDEISVFINDKTVLIENNETKIYTRLLEGDYVKYKNILPTEYKTRIKTNTAEFCMAIERASILSREENNNLIKISIKDESMVITANSEIGRAHEELTAEVEGKELDIAFNAKYLTDVLKNIEAAEVLLDFNTNISPCVIRPVEGDGFLYLVLPVQIRG
jgi:DNA polymerase-3 subunit beta